MDITDPGGEILGAPTASGFPAFTVELEVPTNLALLEGPVSVQAYTIGAGGL